MTFKKLSFLIIIILFSCNSKMKISRSDIVIKSENKNINNPIFTNKKNYNIQTVLLHQKDNQLSKPIINLNSNDILELSFDDLNDNINQFFYSIEHYSFDWKKSNLLNSEFVDGFSKNEVIDYEYSLLKY